jgi:hypothetical protein
LVLDSGLARTRDKLAMKLIGFEVFGGFGILMQIRVVLG